MMKKELLMDINGKPLKVQRLHASKIPEVSARRIYAKI